ncbi:acetoin reductase family protein [Cyathus striatus]|nr:acetoin reductase family protein [Cyathus striatus]
MSKGIAFVTGAAHGIGRAIARRLASDGYNVALNDLQRHQSDLDAVVKNIQETGRKSIGLIGDVSSEQDVERMVKQVVEELGGLDVMVANAGISMSKALSETTVEQWDRMFSVNVRGTFLCFKYAAAQMIAQGRGGNILAACSVSGKQGSARAGLYCSTKFAIRGLVQSAAMEYAPHKIRVNGYAPGVIQTEMLDCLDEQAVKEQGMEPGKWKKLGFLYITHFSFSTRRNGTAEEVAGLASFLVSKDAGFITG